MGKLPTTGLLLLLFCAGCATPPLNVAPVATMSNEATLVYSYSKGKMFRITSAPVEITILMPQASTDAATARADSDTADAASTIESEWANSSMSESHAISTTEQQSKSSQTVVQNARSKMRQTNANASSTSSVMTSHSEQLSASERHEATDARAVQESTSKASSVGQQFAAAKSSELVMHSSISAESYEGAGKSEWYRSDIKDSSAWSTSAANIVHASTDWSIQRPTIRKWATRDRVIVGEGFEYVVEVLNNTGLDLGVVGIGDRLDTRLTVNPTSVRATPYATVDLTNRLLKVKFPQGIKRGDSARIVIPVFLTLDVDN